MNRAKLVLALLLLLLSGCWRAGEHEVVVYTAQDKEYADPVYVEFTKQTKIDVLPKWDAESTKTAGLVSDIFAESELHRTRCDVFWNNEILHTLRLARAGLLNAYNPPIAADYPAMYRAADGRWHGFAARARILLVNTKLVSQADEPKSIRDLLLPKWRGRIAMAKPLFGTTATHAACLFAAWGDEPAQKFFTDLKANGVKIVSGNKQAAESVGNGSAVMAVTDTDDALEEIASGSPVKIVYPDSKPDELGTLFIPNTLAIIHGCPHPAEARKLVDYLLSADVETHLAQCGSSQVPLNPHVTAKPKVETPRTIHAMQVDFGKAAEKWDVVKKFLAETFSE